MEEHTIPIYFPPDGPNKERVGQVWVHQVGPEWHVSPTLADRNLQTQRMPENALFLDRRVNALAKRAVKQANGAAEMLFDLPRPEDL